MRRLPKPKSAKIRYCQTRLPKWAAHAAEIGTTPELVAQLEAATAAARLARRQQRKTIQAARSATLAFNQALARMATLASAIIGQVDIRAKTDGPHVYPLAEIDPPAKGTPPGPPGKPYDLSVSLGEAGDITLRWKCNNPRGTQGTQYQLWRRLDGGPMTFIATASRRRFVDETIPAGTKTVVYQIQATRLARVGPVAQFNVNLGTAPGRPRSAQPTNPTALLAA